jgi:hypothetical protein
MTVARSFARYMAGIAMDRGVGGAVVRVPHLARAQRRLT